MSFQLDAVKKLVGLQRQINALKNRDFAQPQTAEPVNVGGVNRTLQSAFDYVLGLITALTSRVTSLEALYATLAEEIAIVTGGGGTGQISPIKTITTNYTVLITDYTILVDATAGNVTVTLPTTFRGSIFCIKKIDATPNTVTLAPSTGLIDGDTSEIMIYRWTNRKVQSDGVGWFILGVG